MVWNEFDGWNTKAKNTLGFQIIRSSDSIAANITEGFGRYSTSERKNFYNYALGSFEETKAWLRKASRRGLITDSQLEKYKILIDELGPKLNAFIEKTKSYQNRTKD